MYVCNCIHICTHTTALNALPACSQLHRYMEKTKNGLNIYWRDIIEKKGADYFFLLCLMSHVVSSNEK